MQLGSGQTPGELLTPLVLNSILSKALQYSLHGDTALAGNFTFTLRFLPETFHPHAPDSLNCLELRYKVKLGSCLVVCPSVRVAASLSQVSPDVGGLTDPLLPFRHVCGLSIVLGVDRGHTEQITSVIYFTFTVRTHSVQRSQWRQERETGGGHISVVP